MKNTTNASADIRVLYPYFDWDSYWADIKNDVPFKIRMKKMGKQKNRGGYLIKDPNMYAM